MSETIIETSLWSPASTSDDGFIEDDYIATEELASSGGASAVILPLSVFLSLDEKQLRSSNKRIGVRVLPGETIEPLLDQLDRLSLIALEFPAFNDGRSYSKAEILRRKGFTGEIRATGDILIDQAALMLRTGFNTLQVSNHVAKDRLRQNRLVDTPGYYQPGHNSAPQEGNFSWRRVKTD